MIRAPWVSHFGFTHSPFSKSIPATQLCERPSLQEAVARIRFTIAETQIGVLTGEVGVGKTVAIRAATSQLDPAAHHIIYVPNPAFGTRGLYVTIVRALGAIPRGFRAELMAQAQGLLAAEEQERRRRVVSPLIPGVHAVVLRGGSSRGTSGSPASCSPSGSTSA